MKNIINLLVLMLIFTTSTWAQFTDAQIEEFVEKASKKDLVQRNSLLLMDGYFYQSILVVDKLLEMEPDNANFNYRKGFALLSFNSDHNLAKPFLRKAVTNASKIYDGFSHNEDKAPIDSYYYLGRCHHLNKEIKEARDYYNTFLKKTDRTSELIPLAELLLQQCDVAEEFLKTPKKYEIINVGSAINSENPDYAPVVSFDGQALYFTTRRLRADSSNIDIKEPYTNMYMEDVYVSYKQGDGSWGEAELLDFSLPQRNDATIAVSTDERRIYIYRDDVGNGDIFYSDFEDNRFQELERLDIEGVNSDAWEPHITASADGKSKYFVSDRPGGYGGRDIYRIVKLPNGKWSEPQNLGEKVNTKYDEDSPFIAFDNKTLYFASNGPKSMGGFDVFVTILGDDGEWSEPINLGYPLNSMGDDIYYNTTADGYTGYLSSFRPGGEGEKDIYEVRNDYMGIDNIAVLKGKISVLEGQKLPEDVAFTLRCLNCGDDFDRVIYPRIPDGAFATSLQPCRTFEVVFHYGDDRTEFYRETFDTDCERQYFEVERNLILDVPNMKFVEEEEEVFAYNPIKLEHFFGYNKNQLNAKTGNLNEFLMEIKSQINDGREEVVIQIESSASTVPTATFKNNENLARVRAENMKKEIEEFLKSDEVLASKVKVSITKTGVNGPAYKPGSAGDLAIYGPFQYIKLNVDGVAVEDNVQPKTLRSKDDELKGKF